MPTGTVQGDTLAFADSERVGVRYLAPANDLALRVVAARGVAVRAEAGDAAARAALPARSRACVKRSRRSTGPTRPTAPRST